MYNTATGAETTRTIIFMNQKHKDFYLKYLEKCRYQDVYHKALVYCLGIDKDTRSHVNRIYDFKTGCVKTECLREGWMTSSSGKIVRMAFNLYCNSAPSVHDYKEKDEQELESRFYMVGSLFCCNYARFFWEAIRLRYPEYCFL